MSGFTDEFLRMEAQSRTKTFRQCACGAYRPTSPTGEWVAGCLACDHIARLEQLLSAGVRVRQVEPGRLSQEALYRVMKEG